MDGKNIKFQRIIYVEPNDVFDENYGNSQGDLSLTPKYEDFCISFNLIIEQFSRFKSSGTVTDKNGRKNDDGQTRKYVITWGLTQEDLVKRRTSVLQGNRGEPKINTATGEVEYPYSDKYNYLTTYYTDLSYDSYEKNTEIEGLGVESVQISYESWYTPTVTIKFVDVRGSALFGREEAIHVDSHLMAENVFGAFFSMPYPLFRLQVKGFFGKPVTYQLACSGFKGEFNSQTGNFEAVATFIGYSWSLLTDIPFAYLVAAPYDTYRGSIYWEKNRLKPEWGLWNNSETDTIPPPRLYDFFKAIENALKKDEYGKPNEQQSQELQQMGEERTLLNEMSGKYTAFIAALKELVGENCYMECTDSGITGNKQLILFHDREKLPLNDETKIKYNEYYETIQKYEIAEYSGKDEINVNKAPNQWTKNENDEGGIPNELTFVKLLNINVDSNNDNNGIEIVDSTQINVDFLLNKTLNEKNGKLTKTSANQLYGAINSNENKLKPYCYLVDLYKVFDEITNRNNEMVENENKITKAINEAANQNIIEILGGVENGGFKPFIGNIFKMIFCHLETLCHIMFDSADDIYSQMKTGKRKPSELNVNLGEERNQTDIIPRYGENITPWPALYNDGVVLKDVGYKSNLENVYAWPGDFGKHNFIEEKVVFGLQEGIQIITKDSKNTTTNDSVIKTAALPILPSDYLNGGVFSSVNVDYIPELAGHLANRIASIIGVCCGNNVTEEMTETFGKLDACNLYSRKGSIVTFGNLINNKKFNIDTLLNIMLCTESEEMNEFTQIVNQNDPNIRRFQFENVSKIDNKFANPQRGGSLSRYPFFKEENGDRLLYVHFYDNKYANYVPSKIKSFNEYKTTDKNKGDFKFTVESKDKLYFIPQITKSNVNNETVTNAHDWLHVCDSTKIGVLKDSEVDIEKYTNKQMFSIITNESEITAIKNKCNELLNGSIKIMDYEVKEDLSNFVEKFVGVNNKFYHQYFDGVRYMLSGNAEQLKLDKSYFIPSNNANEIKQPNWYEWYENRKGDRKNDVKVDENCDFLFNDEKTTLSDLVIQQFLVFYKEKTKGCNLFGCPFYYLQNKKANGKEDDENLYKQRVLKSKAYLFLSTFRYGTKIPNIFDSQKKNGIIQAIPKAYLLFYGAILWRKRFKNKNGYDPIISESNTNKYANEGVDYTFIAKINDMDFFRIVSENQKSKIDYYPVSAYIGGNEIDFNIENQLIDLFNDFVDNTFSKISSKYELKRIDNGNQIDYDDTSLIDTIGNYYHLTITNKEVNKVFFSDFLDANFYGLRGNYNALTLLSGINTNEQGFKMLLNENNKEDQELFKDLYFNSYVVIDNCNRRLGQDRSDINDNDKIYVKTSLLKSYLKGFVDTSQNILNSQTISIGDDGNLNVSSNTFRNRDLSIAIYYYLKNLWDKWLVISKTDAFDVANFYQNFVFIDSFYTKIENELAINCELLLEAWKELADNGSLFHFLSQIVSKHGCIFLPVPDFVGFNGNTQDDTDDVETMKKLFRPMPYNEIEAPSNSNKFIVMYTHSPAHVKTNQNAYVLDSYDIWSHKDGRITKEAAELFREKKGDGDITRLGYNVPSFGIAFAKQNNHIFKNLRLTMDNPVMTEQAIKAQWQIAITGGSSEAHSIHFIGQDTFNVFSNYSYSITVDMLGNAQICPLMYFQLLNVPLWKGTYMIYKVVHNMTPGDMTTTITGMKMSRFAQPFNTNFFTIHEIKKANQNGNGLNSDCDDGTDYGGTEPSISGGMITNAPTVNVKDDGAYNLVLWRYNTSKASFPHKLEQGVGRSSHSIEGVIYEAASKKILTWTIQSDVFDRIGGKSGKGYYNIVPSAGYWETEKGEKSYRYGCSSYCASLTKGGGYGFSGQAGVSGSMLRIEASDYNNSGGCLFHPGQNAGGGWTTGCILCGEKAVNGNRPNFNLDDYHADKIKNTNNVDVIWWKNFYKIVCPKILSGTKVHLYVSNERKNVAYDGAVIESGGSVIGKPTGNLVNIMDSLPADLKPYVIINPIYATTKNFGGRVMPGYKQGQKYLWIGKRTMEMLIKSVRYMRSKTEYQNYKLMIWDAYRPWEAADNFCKIAPQKYIGTYISRCKTGKHSGSPHCVGKALDLTLTDLNGNPIPMFDLNKATCSWATETGGFDEFSKEGRSNPNNTNQQKLRDIMMIFDKYGKKTNFGDYPAEFWHFTSYYNETDGSQNYG